ncbi:phosphoribulokinase/uridine kinase family protein [Enterobacter hormaechei]|nr:phosphoribulokinase/uridine kinase family protein [Enterobacter hormaechei]
MKKNHLKSGHYLTISQTLPGQPSNVKEYWRPVCRYDDVDLQLL